MPNLTKPQLLDKALQSILEGGWLPIVIEDRHPFLVRASKAGSESVDLRIYIWNCTHGGGGRARDEFRIQVTGVSDLRRLMGEKTLILGWHDEKQVFAAWDINAHDGQIGSSPSAQIREVTLDSAHHNFFAIQRKENEVVVACRPAFLIDYALSIQSLHSLGSALEDNALLNELPALTDEAIGQIDNEPRRSVIRAITVKYRNRRFSETVLRAYGHRCSFCGVQLALLDAAHIIPVAAPGSTDEIINGIALCKTHHFAYDSNLVSFNEDYRIEVGHNRVEQLQILGQIEGLEQFRGTLSENLTLPARAADYPSRVYIRRSRLYRAWRG